MTLSFIRCPVRKVKAECCVLSEIGIVFVSVIIKGKCSVNQLANPFE
jgi:hypothetical protein